MGESKSMEKLKRSAKVVQDMLETKGYHHQVIELSDSTRTAKEAAEALNCQVAQIAKSIVFKRVETDEALIVVASGSNRVNEKTIETFIGEPLGKADAAFVKNKTGHVIGGVSPVVQDASIKIIIDEDLFLYEEIWGAAGHPKAVFQLTPSELVELTGGDVLQVKE